jgi:cyclopropane-fatty-acyl-phospholipid synthase
MEGETFVRRLLGEAGIELNGPNPWDLQVHRPELYARVLAEGTIGLGEAYMDGWWDCGQLDEFFHRANVGRLGPQLKMTPELAWLWLRSVISNRQRRSRVWRAADVHYNLDVAVFEATFDRRLTGSCGYWADADDLDSAQEAKLDLICRKVGLRPGQRVCDIGCGWGAFMGYAAERYGADCVGVTISEEQARYGRARYAGLPVEFQVLDYRNFKGEADHVVSMGMFEHVGPKNYRAYFEAARRALRPGGLFLLHTIFAKERWPAIDPWLDKYIFPGGVLPTVGQIGEAVDGLFVVEDLENFGADYDRTLMAWQANFRSNWGSVAERHGERFCRMWDYYLCCCAGGFRSRGISVGHFVLSPEGVPGGWRRPGPERAAAPRRMGRAVAEARPERV